jgi:hypothetical protein
MTVWPAATSTPAVILWTARAAISGGAVEVSAHTAEVRMNAASADSHSRPAPRPRTSHGVSASTADRPRRYAVTTHWISPRPVCRFARIDSRPTATIEPSMLPRNPPRAMTDAAAQAAREMGASDRERMRRTLEPQLMLK